jgi:hypothetical protein
VRAFVPSQAVNQMRLHFITVLIVIVTGTSLIVLGVHARIRRPSLDASVELQREEARLQSEQFLVCTRPDPHDLADS